MPRDDAERRAPRRADRRTAVRDRIVRGAAELVFRHGVAGTGIEQILAVSGTSRSQLYHQFADKEAVIEAVVDFQIAAVLARQGSLLRAMDSLAGLQDEVVAMTQARKGSHGCPLGSLVSQLAERPGTKRTRLRPGGRTQGGIHVRDERLAALPAAGVSVWLDDLSRDRLISGDLRRLLDDKHVVGVTINPTIFAAAVARGERVRLAHPRARSSRSDGRGRGSQADGRRRPGGL